MFERARTERGASMVEYALLVGLIAVVAVVAVAALGGGISNLFSSANSCVGNAANC
jgi:pilus assembly protein Flp/PilA